MNDPEHFNRENGTSNNKKQWLKTGVKSLARKCRIVDDTDDGKTNPVQSLFNVINANLGTGILAMPFVIRLGGYWGILMTIVIGFLGNYTGKVLVSLLYEVGDNGSRIRVRDTYADIGQAFSPKYGACMVHVVNCVEQFCHCVLLLIMPGTVIASMFPSSGMRESMWILLLSLIVIPSIFFRKMHQVTWSSIVTVIIVILISVIVLFVCFIREEIASMVMTSFAPFDIHLTPTSFGIVMVTYSSQAYLPSIERCMREPELFNPLLNFAYIFLVVFKCGIGVIVYLCFADSTEQIMTLNLPHNIFGDVINMAAIVASLTFYTVPMFTVFDIIENQISLPKFCEKLLDTENTYCGTKFLTVCLVFRFVIVMAFICIAAALPHFSLMMSFVGNTTGTILVLLFPSLFYLKIRWNSISPSAVVGNFFIVAIAIGSVILGVNSTARAFYSVFTIGHHDVTYSGDPDS